MKDGSDIKFESFKRNYSNLSASAGLTYEFPKVVLLRENGVFRAAEVLAKHDENYMPPEVTKAINDAKGSIKKTAVTSDAPLRPAQYQ